MFSRSILDDLDAWHHDCSIQAYYWSSDLELIARICHEKVYLRRHRLVLNCFVA